MNIEAIGTNGKSNGHLDHTAAALEIAATNAGTAPDPAPEQPAKTMEVRTLRIADLVLDAAVHVRAQTDEKRVEQYAAEYLAGDAFPAIDVFDDGATKIVANGFHRTRARAKAGFDDILCNVRPGGRREAILFALTQDRNLPRTNADKRKAATQLLSDPVWRDWTDAVIARMCDVTPQFVGKLAKEMGVRNPIRKTANGRTIDTTRMGPKPTAKKSRTDKVAQPQEQSGARGGASRNGFGSEEAETFQSSAAAAYETAADAPLVGASSNETPASPRADEGSLISAPLSVAAQTDQAGPVVGSHHDPVDRVLRLILDLAADQRESVVVAVFEDLAEAARGRVLHAIGARLLDETVRVVDAKENSPATQSVTAPVVADGAVAPKSRKAISEAEASELRARMEVAIVSGEITVTDLVESQAFTDRQHVNKFRRGAGLAPKTASLLGRFLDARTAR